jgi:DNA-binding NtrC family response regulator
VERGLAKLLLVHPGAFERQSIAEHFRRKTGADVETTRTVPEGIEKIATRRFDLALIDAPSPESPVMELAALAAQRNIPVLCLSGNSFASAELRGLGYQYLEKPLDCDLLVRKSMWIMGENRRLITELAAATDKMETNIRRLKAEIKESHRLFDAIVRRLGY